MAILTFPIDTVRRIVEHTKQHGECLVPYGGGEVSKKLTFNLVKDHGCYIMASTKVSLLTGEGTKNVVGYAKGHDPEVAGWDWDDTQYALGGDDFAEALPLAWLEIALKQGECKISVAANSIKLVEKPVINARFKDSSGTYGEWEEFKTAAEARKVLVARLKDAEAGCLAVFYKGRTGKRTILKRSPSSVDQWKQVSATGFAFEKPLLQVAS